MHGHLEKIWIKRARLGPMDTVVKAKIETGSGLTGNADQGGKRQVTIISKETWDRACESLGSDVSPTARRANMLVSGLNLAQSRGNILLIGSCQLRIEGETRPCNRMDEAHPGLQEALKTDWGGGVYCSVIRGGDVKVGDSVILMPGEKQAMQ